MKTILTVFEKCQFFDFVLYSLFYSLKKFYLFLEYRQTLFSSLFCLKKWQNGKSSIFDQTTDNNANFLTFLTSCFLSLERGFFFYLKYRQTVFPCLFWIKEKGRKKIKLFYQKDGLSCLVKCHFYYYYFFLTPCFDCLERRFYI